MERLVKSGRNTYRVGLLVLSIFWIFHQVHGQKTPCVSQTVGVPDPGSFIDNVDTNTGNAYMLSGTNLQVPCCGVLKRWKFYSKGTGELRAHLWRNAAGSSYNLLGETIISASDISSDQYISFGAEGFTTDKGDTIGWYTNGLDIVSYNDIAVDPVSDGVMSQVTTPTQGSATTWSSVPNNGRRYAFGAQLGPSTAPTFTNIPETIQKPVSTPVGDVVFTLAVDDEDVDDVGLGLTINLAGSSNYFEVDSGTGEVKVKAALTVGTYTVPFTVTDFCETTSVVTELTIEVTDDIPDITSLPVSAYELKEDTVIETAVHTLQYTDDGPLEDVTCTFTVSPSPAPFVMEHSAPTEHSIVFKPSSSNKLDADTTALYRFNCTCNDGTSDSVTRPFEVSIIKNEEPVFDPPDEITVSAADTTNRTVVENVAGTDPEDNRLNYTMTCDCPFAIEPSTGDIYATEDLNAHRDSPYTVNLYVTDGWNTVGPKTTTITITDLNTPPTLTKPASALPKIDSVTFKENTDETAGTRYLVYTVEGEDAEGDDLTYEAEWEDGSVEEFFTFDPDTGQIKTAIDLNYEKLLTTVGDRFYVDLKAYDGREHSETKRLEVIITDENEEPKFKQEKYTLDAEEDSAYTELDCAFFSVDDPDLSDYHKYTIDCGSNGIYHVDGSSVSCTAIIKMSAEHDLDNPGRAFEVVSCVVTVEDKGGLTDTAELEITVREIDDNPPELEQAHYTYYVTNETDPFTIFGDIGFTDDDDFLAQHKEHTYTLSSNNFGIDKDGRMYNKINLYGASVPQTFTYYVTATDNAGHTDTARVDVNVMAAPTTTTSTTTTTQFPSVYNGISSFFDDVGNLAWFIPAMILSALFLGLLTYACVRCFTTPGACSAFRGGRCFRGSRRVGAHGRNSRPPARTRATPPRSQRPEQRPSKEEPARKRRLFDCFDRKDKGAGDPAKPDEGRMWEAWKDDFQTKNWVG